MSERKPRSGTVYADSNGRLFTVTEVTVRPTVDGRDVRGYIVRPEKHKSSAGVQDKEVQADIVHPAFTDPQEYACSFGIFNAVWTEERYKV